MSESKSEVTTAQQHRGRGERRIVLGTMVALGLLVAGGYGVLRGPGILAAWRYEPRVGDVVFQSLPRSPLVNAIEGSTNSPWSHCGIVAYEDDKWVVYEALEGVERTPLRRFLGRSREQRWAAYRLREPDWAAIPSMIDHAKNCLGRPYDARYRWDDEAIYCSELVGKAFHEATGRDLGERVPLASLDWQPFERTIRHLEGGSLPLERRMLTPRDLAAAPELRYVTGSP